MMSEISSADEIPLMLNVADVDMFCSRLPGYVIMFLAAGDFPVLPRDDLGMVPVMARLSVKTVAEKRKRRGGGVVVRRQKQNVR